jgi:hypothetical protein
MNTNRKTITTLFAAWSGAMITVFAVYVMAIAPAQSIAIQKHGDFLKRAAALDHAANLFKERSLFLSMKKLQKANKKFEQFVRNSDTAHNFALEISQIAKKIGIVDLETTGNTSDMFLSIPNCPNIAVSKMAVIGTGNYKQFARFINAMERYSPMILIHSFDIEAEETASGVTKMKMNLRMIVEGKSLEKNRKKLQLTLTTQNESR